MREFNHPFYWGNLNMAKLFKSLIRRTVFRKQHNLVALDEYYDVMGRLLKKHKVTGILDAGASHGRITKKLLRLFPDSQAYLFEPQSMYREKLNKYAEEDIRVHPYFVALSDKEGTIELHVTESPGCTSLYAPADNLQKMYPQAAGVKAIEMVEMTTIDQWCRNNGEPDIEMMKFDIQGAELSAMRGAMKTLKSTTLLVFTEIMFNPLYEGGAIYSEIDLCLRDAGFRLYNIYKVNEDANGGLVQANAIFISEKIWQSPAEK